LDALRQGFVDLTLEVNLHAASKAAEGAAFVKVTPDKPLGPHTKARKAAADKGKVASKAAVASRANPIAKPTNTPRPPPKK
jgi:hypothetical protein